VYWPHTHLSPSSLRWRSFTWSPQVPPAPQRYRFANASAHYLSSSWVILTPGFPQTCEWVWYGDVRHRSELDQGNDRLVNRALGRGNDWRVNRALDGRTIATGIWKQNTRNTHRVASGSLEWLTPIHMWKDAGSIFKLKDRYFVGLVNLFRQMQGI
jgi:hypothetical protein